MRPHLNSAILALASGEVFTGHSVGDDVCSIGELVFNTSMTGYQEILSDPSYTRQMVLLTYPHIGNTGVNDEDMESACVHACALVVKDIPLRHANFRAHSSLPDFLKKYHIPAIAGIDTRALTAILRDKGAQNAALITQHARDTAQFEGFEFSAAYALKLAQSCVSMEGQNLAEKVSCTNPYTWQDGVWALPPDIAAVGIIGQGLHVVVHDYGVKHNILRLLSSLGMRVTVVPYATSLNDILALQPDGVLLSNGPGDPGACTHAINIAQTLLVKKISTFGICLGHQILGLALGAKTQKMKFGHHGANHPVQDLYSKKVFITSQNHGFAIDESTLPANVQVTHRSLFDQSIQGVKTLDAPAFGFQGHPEASPGPHDLAGLFDAFVASMRT